VAAIVGTVRIMAALDNIMWARGLALEIADLEVEAENAAGD
jgi:hypothetical protein